jgi:hypothetical protein
MGLKHATLVLAVGFAMPAMIGAKAHADSSAWDGLDVKASGMSTDFGQAVIVQDGGTYTSGIQTARFHWTRQSLNSSNTYNQYSGARWNADKTAKGPSSASSNSYKTKVPAGNDWGMPVVADPLNVPTGTSWGADVPVPGASYVTFCVQLGEIANKDLPFEVRALEALPSIVTTSAHDFDEQVYRSNLIRALWGDKYGALDALLSSTTATADQKKAGVAAFQVALWEMLYETEVNGDGDLVFDAGTGQMKFWKNTQYTDSTNSTKHSNYNANLTYQASANALLDDVVESVMDHSADYATVYGLVDHQDQLFWTNAPGAPVVPIPGTAAGVFAMTLGCLVRRRR